VRIRSSSPWAAARGDGCGTVMAIVDDRTRQRAGIFSAHPG
jgi:hypothetical protein